MTKAKSHQDILWVRYHMLEELHVVFASVLLLFTTDDAHVVEPLPFEVAVVWGIETTETLFLLSVFKKH